jgi:hypothetical protein
MSVVHVGKTAASPPVAEQSGSRTFRRVMRVLAAVPLLIGLAHVVFGVAMDAQLGALAPGAASDPVLDSQNRFFGGTFAGYGVLLYLGLTDLKRYAVVFRIAGCGIAFGGVARLVSIALRGLPPLPVLGLIVVELVVVPLLLGWHARILARS